MPIPDFQTLMLPLLKFAADGKEHTQSEAIADLAKQFKLREDELNEMVPSGQQPIFENRVNWSKTYLKKSGLLEYPRRGAFRITDKGKQILSQNPERINTAFLRQFPEFLEFHAQNRTEKGSSAEQVRQDVFEEKSTPEEILAKGYSDIRRALTSDILERVLNISPAKFERLVIDLLVKMGYGGGFKDAGTHSGKSGDEGIDGTIKEDKLGLDIIYIQAKKWKSGNVVDRPEIHKFIGALAGQGAKKGVFITTSTFTKGAREYVPRNETKIVLIDGDELAQLMIDHNLGVSTISTYEVKRVDNDYFGEE